MEVVYSLPRGVSSNVFPLRQQMPNAHESVHSRAAERIVCPAFRFD